MSKLYELLAVESDLRSQATEELKRVKDLFTSGTGKLIGQSITYHGLTEDAQELPQEVTELATTVENELDQLQEVYGKFLDVTILKERANTHTEAESEKFQFLNELPATALLNLESRLQELEAVYKRIPTLDPSEKWAFDSGSESWVSDTRIAYRTAKVPKSFVAYEATKEHPAQVETFTEDVPSHRRETIVQTGSLTIADKRRKIERINTLIRAVKQARQRANDVEVGELNISVRIFSFINEGTLE
jgi:hypothetical protein